MNDERLHGMADGMENNGAEFARGSHSFRCSSTLKTGLLLEDRNILLPWGARLLQLSDICLPTRQVNHIAWEELFWNHPILLDGLQIRYLQAILYPYGWFDSAWGWLERGTNHSACQAAFDRAGAHLESIFGQPIPCPAHSQGEAFEQISTWEQGDWRVGLFLRTGDIADGYDYASLVHIANHSPSFCPYQGH